MKALVWHSHTPHISHLTWVWLHQTMKALHLGPVGSQMIGVQVVIILTSLPTGAGWAGTGTWVRVKVLIMSKLYGIVVRPQ